MDALPVFFQGLIAFCASFALLSGLIKMFLLPLQKDIAILKEGQKELKENFKEMKEDLDTLKEDFKILKDNFKTLLEVLKKD